jgi:hypothetical protein
MERAQTPLKHTKREREKERKSLYKGKNFFKHEIKHTAHAKDIIIIIINVCVRVTYFRERENKGKINKF